MTCASENASTAVRLPLWDYPTQDIAETAPSKAILNTAPIMSAKPSLAVTDLLASRATKLHRHSPLKQRRYLSVCQSLANGGCSTDARGS